MSTINQNIKEQGEDTLNVKDFLFMCLAKWHWFVLSLIVTLSCYVVCPKDATFLYTFFASND